MLLYSISLPSDSDVATQRRTNCTCQVKSLTVPLTRIKRHNVYVCVHTLKCCICMFTSLSEGRETYKSIYTWNYLQLL